METIAVRRQRDKTPSSPSTSSPASLAPPPSSTFNNVEVTTRRSISRTTSELSTAQELVAPEAPLPQRSNSGEGQNFLKIRFFILFLFLFLFFLLFYFILFYCG